MKDLEEVLQYRLARASWVEVARILQVIRAWKMKKFLTTTERLITHLHPWVRYRALETLLSLGEEGRERTRAILVEHRHIVFPVLEDLNISDM